MGYPVWVRLPLAPRNTNRSAAANTCRITYDITILPMLFDIGGEMDSTVLTTLKDTAVIMNVNHLNQLIQTINAETIGPLGDILTGANVPMELMAAPLYEFTGSVARA